MSHPSVAEILSVVSGEAGAPAIEAHLASCAACRILAGLRAPITASIEPSGPFDPGAEPLLVPVVDRRFYTRCEDISGGRGGMGRTFRAWDRRLGRMVALKELFDRETLPDPAARAMLKSRFEREAQLTARLEHPAIVGVHEAGRWDDGEPFYAMRLIRGTPLDQEIEARATLAPRLALIPRLTVVAEAIAYAHDQGIIHRDIKPGNVLLGQFGETVVIDWGLAKDLRASDDAASAEPCAHDLPSDGLTEMGFGTPQYMPPEQARGEAPDHGFDVYALGATLYHLLAGTPPYGFGSSAEIRARLLAGPPPPIAELAPDAPADLHDLVDKAMAREPGRRFRTALELAEDLRRFQTGQLTRTRRYPLRELLGHWARRNRAGLRVGAAALASLVILGALGVGRIVHERDRAEANERLAQRELQKALGQTASQLAPHPARRIEAVALGVKAVGSALRAGLVPPSEGVQGLVDALTAGPLLVPLRGHHGTVRDFDVSPDGATLVTVGTDRTARLWDARSGRPQLTLTSALSSVDYVRFSPRGDRVLVWGYDQDAEIWDLARRESVHLPGKDRVAGGAFTPDGRFVVTADTEAASVWDLVTGRLIRRMELDHPASSMSMSATGRIAIGTTSGATILGDSSATARLRLEGQRAEIRQTLFTPDGLKLVTADAEGRFLLWDLAAAPPRAVVLQDDATAPVTLFATMAEDGRHVALLTPRGTVVFDLLRPGARTRIHAGVESTFPREGGGLYSVTDDGRLRAWDVESGRETLRLDGPDDAGESVRAFTDGKGGPRIAAAGKNGAAYLRDARTGLAAGLLLGHTGEIVAARASARGAHLLTASLDGTARIWDLASGASVVLRGPSELVDARFSPDERLVVTAGLDGTARVFEAAGREIFGVRRSAEPLTAAAFSPDGQRLLTASLDGTVTLWDATTGETRRALDADVVDPGAGAVTAAAFSPDGHLVIAGYADRSVRLWDAASGEAVATLPNDDPEDRGGITHAAFSPDGDAVIVSFGAGYSLICGGRDLAPSRRLEGRAASATGTPFSPDGRLVVTVGGDGRVLVNDRASGTAVILDGHAKLVLSTTFSSDGKRLVTAGIDGTLRLWDLDREATILSIESAGQGEATWAELTPDGCWILAAYSSGALRLHPATAESALGRACDALAYFEKTAETEGICP